MFVGGDYHGIHHLLEGAVQVLYLYGVVNLLNLGSPKTMERNLSTLFTGTALPSRKHPPNETLV